MTKAMTVICAAAAMALVPAAQAEETEFDEAEIFFELNNTDGDLGIHGKVDGGPWTYVKIEGHNGRKLMSIQARGRLWFQEVTELFFESAEPTFDELSAEDFFRRFPEGEYEVTGWSRDVGLLESETEVTHTMPAPAVVSVNDMPMAQVCDDEDPQFDPTVVPVGMPVTLTWEPVTLSHPDLGTMPPVEVEIVNYEVVLETAVELGDDEEFESILSVTLPPGSASFQVPAEFLELGDEFKYEILAREDSYNQTAVESCFVFQDDDDDGADN